MDEMAQLAGFLAGHAILCVSKGKTLTMPMLVVEKEDGSTQFIEVTAKSSEQAVEKAEKLMTKATPGARQAVMGFEAYLNLPPGKTDAIFLHACSYQPEPQEIHVAVPFRLAKHRLGFAVFRPKFIAFEDAPPPLTALDAFMRGVELSPGKEIWKAKFDNSR